MLYDPQTGPDEADPEELFDCRLCWGEWPECDMANPSLCRECFSGFEPDPEPVPKHPPAVSRPPYRQCTQKGCRQPTRWKFGAKQIARCWDHRPGEVG